jgi:hypothetical protein
MNTELNVDDFMGDDAVDDEAPFIQGTMMTQ